MNRKTFLTLVGITLLLAAIYVATKSSYEKPELTLSVTLLENVKAKRISSIRLSSGEETVDLVLNDGRWGVLAKRSYPADAGKIRSLLLSLFELKSSQRITENQDHYQQLGVSDEDVARGKTKVEFFDESQSSLGGLFIGNQRSGNGAQSAVAGGRYVRVLGSDAVYMVSSNVDVKTNQINWLDQSLANVLERRIERIKQIALGGDNTAEDFTLVRETVDDEWANPRFVLTDDTTIAPESAAASQIRKGLENLRLTDVGKADEERFKEAVFDLQTTYGLSNALTYMVQSAVVGEKYFLKVSVGYDSDLANALTLRHEEAKNKGETAIKSAATENESTDEEQKNEPIQALPPLELSSEDEAKKLTEQFTGWIFEVAKYQGEKFRVTRTKLLE